MKKKIVNKKSHNVNYVYLSRAQKYMTRKKLNKKRIDVHITETNYKRLLILCNEETTLTDMINQCIEWKYNGIYKKPDAYDRPIDPLLKNLTEEEKEQIELANINWLEGDNQ